MPETVRVTYALLDACRQGREHPAIAGVWVLRQRPVWEPR